MKENAIVIENLVKEYAKSGSTDKFLALDSMDLTVPKGSIFGLLGPNGAGKSTLINILAGTTVMTSGRVSVLGVDIVEYPKSYKSLIGIVPQEIILDTFFTLEQSMEFTAGYYGIRKSDRKTEEILRALGLWDKRDNISRQLSGGMKRRFLMAKAMVHSPKVLILDEPTAGVDIDLRNQLWNYVRKLNSEGMTIIITTHYLAEAQELCDEIAFINKGKIIKQDSTRNILSNLGTHCVDIEFNNNVGKYDINISSEFVYEFINENKIRFNFRADEGNYTNLLKQIIKTGFDIKDIKISDPDLEKIFLKIMQD